MYGFGSRTVEVTEASPEEVIASVQLCDEAFTVLRPSPAAPSRRRFVEPVISAHPPEGAEYARCIVPNILQYVQTSRVLGRAIRKPSRDGRGLRDASTSRWLHRHVPRALPGVDKPLLPPDI